MLDRHWLGDLGFAILLAFPLAALALDQSAPKQIVNAARATALAPLHSNGRISLLA